MTDRAFLSLVKWPPGLDRQDLIAALAAVAGTDPFHGAQRLAPGHAPVVIQPIDAAVAPEIIAALRQRGITAIAPTRTLLRDFAPPIRAKRLARALGAPEPMFLCEPWRDEPFGFAARDIGIIVRARLSRTKWSGPRMEMNATVPMSGMVITDYMVVRDTKFSMHDILDIYLRDRRRVRCSGDKFNFDILGEARGLTDNENMDKLSLLLAEAAPRAVVDLGFSDFTCPPGITREFHATPRGGGTLDDHPVFDFYSPWIVQVYRELVRTDRPR